MSRLSGNLSTTGAVALLTFIMVSQLQLSVGGVIFQFTHGSNQNRRNGEELPVQLTPESEISLEELKELCSYVAQLLESRLAEGVQGGVKPQSQLEKTLLPICRLLASIYDR